MTAEPPDEPPHDVLAAEEFSVPAQDPSLHSEPPHDVLAAEEFAVPEGDVTLRHGPTSVPEAPFSEGSAEPPHDVLAAEEFAVPAGPVTTGARAVSDAVAGRGRWWLAGALGAAVTVALRRRR